MTSINNYLGTALTIGSCYESACAAPLCLPGWALCSHM